LSRVSWSIFADGRISPAIIKNLTVIRVHLIVEFYQVISHAADAGKSRAIRMGQLRAETID